MKRSFIGAAEAALVRCPDVYRLSPNVDARFVHADTKLFMCLQTDHMAKDQLPGVKHQPQPLVPARRVVSFH